MVAGRCSCLNIHVFPLTACTTLIGAEGAKHSHVDMLAIEKENGVETPMTIVAPEAIALQLVEWDKGEA